MPKATQTIKGKQYVYEYKSTWNKQKQRSEQKRNYIGKITNGTFTPNKKHQLQQQLNNQQKTNPNHTSNNQKPTTTTKQNPIFPLPAPTLNKHIKQTQPHNISSKQQNPNKHPPAQTQQPFH